MPIITKDSLSALRALSGKPFCNHPLTQRNINELTKVGYIESTFVATTLDVSSSSSGEEYVITDEGLAYVDSQEWFDTSYIVRNIITPIIIAVVSTILTTTLLGLL